MLLFLSDLKHSHLSASLGSAPEQPQMPIKCPDAVTQQQQEMDDQGLPHCSWKQAAPSYSYSLFPICIHWRYLHRSSLPAGPWGHQTRPILIPDQAPASQLLILLPKLPILETPISSKVEISSFIPFFLN